MSVLRIQPMSQRYVEELVWTLLEPLSPRETERARKEETKQNRKTPPEEEENERKIICHRGGTTKKAAYRVLSCYFDLWH